MILIDEAHHSTAKTWVDTINYFSKAKVVKLTGTPFRSDNEKIAGELVYKYKLSQAMANNSVAYAPECSKKIVDKSIELLEEKKSVRKGSIRIYVFTGKENFYTICITFPVTNLPPPHIIYGNENS